MLMLAVPLAALLGATAVAGVPVGTCSAVTMYGPAEYYAIDLVSTGRVPGSRGAAGVAEVTSARSPFGIALTPAGAYRQQLSVRVDGMRGKREGRLAVWLTTPELDQVRFLGTLEDGVELRGEVSLNKFLVVVTLEAADVDGASSAWQGPVVLRGASRSGRMHTMAGHGPWEGEPCVKYGY